MKKKNTEARKYSDTKLLKLHPFHFKAVWIRLDLK